MPDTADASEGLKGTGYEIFLAVLSVLSIVNLVLAYAVDAETLRTVLYAMNGLLSVIFMGDFVYRLATARSKSDYFLRQYGWADLLASLPFEQFKIMRIFRLLRVYRLLRAAGVEAIGRALLKDRAGSALYTLLLMGILVLQFGSLWILRIEDGAEGANIVSASDALWYVIVTISTVGYGDRYPVTNAGRLFGACIIIIGVGIFGTFTGYLANLFLSPSAPDADVATGEAADLRGKVSELQRLLAQQQTAMTEVERLLEASEG